MGKKMKDSKNRCKTSSGNFDGHGIRLILQWQILLTVWAINTQHKPPHKRMVRGSIMTPQPPSQIYGVLFKISKKLPLPREGDSIFFYVLALQLWPGFLLQDKQRKMIESQGPVGPGDVAQWLRT